ncbi:MAG: alpha-amylase [Chloroflexi bacterium]|nr:alpha-amylase [Chloroflexota bacterium]
MDTRHLSRHARDRFALESLRFADLSSARKVAAQINASAGDIYALGLIDEALRIVLTHNAPPAQMASAASFLDGRVGAAPVRATTLTFVSAFPTKPIYEDKLKPEEYLAPLRLPQNSENLGGVAHSAEGGGVRASLEELLLVNIHNSNPAAQPLVELFDDQPLEKTAYEKMIEGLGEFFGQRSEVKGRGESLIDMLRAPALASPYSLEGQLEYIIERWGTVLGEEFVTRLLRAMDFVREDVIRTQGHSEFQPTAEAPTYAGYPEYERYSPDKEWMPRLVLIAKNAYVWLDQLSKKYQRNISTLDQVPDEELDTLAQRGFTGLWLIGLWERSRASQKMKQRMGQEDAVASAYSLNSYDIANDLGGWGALENLRWRAWQRGIRLSADMVPNHMGIDSTWVIEHPDWFLSLDQPPYPSYTFDSENLMDHPNVGVILEDHYYNHSDASVVFKRFDRTTGDVRYIYHGNDGTSFPWNDTAQLNYLKAEVREAVIQTILHVARNFPIIRFDAAMTLAKKHVQRLWFPEPGAGGAIPSRAERGLTRSEFEAAMPEEFWREVVDRVAAEVPDTLLLAEAFWLMEGYFVRTLGMHRVYNSAFMHMLRDEDNAKYRMAIKNTLEFDARILQRYVNFMNNPDEKTAVEQFGKADKYFGVCVLLSTLPGLPMFGHGQVEGFHEKYGMEYRRAKWDETPDEGFVRYHEQIISPLLHRRRIFAGVDNFFLYDLFTPEGHVDENVFAYSNRFENERGLVIYHNKFADTRGRIKTSAAYLENGQLQQKSLADALELPNGQNDYVTFRDYVTNLEYIRSCREIREQGLYVELGAYKCHTFLDFRFVDGGEWRMVNEALNGAGVESVQAKWEEMFGVKEVVKSEVTEEESVKRKTKKPAVKKRAVKKPAIKKTAEKKADSKKPPEKKPAEKKPAKKKSASKKSTVKKSTTKAKSIKSPRKPAAKGKK